MEETTYLTATGPIDFNMTNDYMFRVILQENEIVLRGLICSLLRLQKEEIQSVKVTNPILLGENIDEKEYILDVNVELNNDTTLNLEMQMENQQNWTDRALSYTCRNFTHTQKGHDYREAKQVYQIGFLNYTLFPEFPEFYATYMVTNIKTYQLFSSKIHIGVVDLNRTDLATDDDKLYALDQWVALFKSRTWEELRMIAKEKPELLEATKSLYDYNSEDVIRYRCYAREDYRKEQNSIRRDKGIIKDQAAKIEAQAAEIEALSSEIEALKAELNQLKTK